MDYHSPMPIQQFDSPIMDNSISQNEEYLEYRRLVFQELAADNGKRKSHEFFPSVEIPTDFESFALDMRYPISPALQEYDEYRTQIEDGASASDSQDDQSKDSPTQQPLWDDSDLKTDLILSPSRNADLSYKKDNVRTQFSHFSEQKPSTDDDVVSETTDLLSHHTFHSTSSVDNDNCKSSVTPPLSPYSAESKRANAKSHIIKQRNDRRAVLQKLSCEDDTEQDPFSCGNGKPWYNPKMERLNSQNLKICYINDTSSSSEGEENAKNLENLAANAWVPPSPSLTPLSPTFLKRTEFNRMQSSSSISSTSSAGHGTSTSLTPIDRGIINVRATVTANETPPKVLSMEEKLELEARLALAKAQKEAKRIAEEERQKSKRGSTSSFEMLSLSSISGEIRSKVKTRSLNRRDCQAMSISQLQVILNSMHGEKEEYNKDLKSNLETRDELRTEKDAKLIDVFDLKAMLQQSGPETTV